MGLIRELLIDGVVGKAVGRFEELKRQYPLKKARLHSAILVLVLVTMPLALSIGAVQLCLLAWDLFEPFSIPFPLYLHLVPFILLSGAIAFSVFLLWQIWGVLGLFYEPLDELVDGGVADILGPVRVRLLKMDLAVLGTFIAIYVAIMAHGLFTSFSAFHSVLMFISMVLTGLMAALSIAAYMIIKGILLLIFNKMLRKLDERFGLSKRLRKLYGPLKRKTHQ